MALPTPPRTLPEPPRPGLPTAPASTPSRTLPGSTVANPTTNETRALRLAPLTGLPPRLPIVTNVPRALPRALPRRVGTRGPRWDPTGTVQPPCDGDAPPGQRDPARGVGWPSFVLSSVRSQGPADGRWSCDRGRAAAQQRVLSRGACARQDSRRRPGGRAVGVGAPRIPVPFRGCSNEPRCLPGRA